MQPTVEYEKWYMEVYGLMNPIEVNIFLVENQQYY